MVITSSKFVFAKQFQMAGTHYKMIQIGHLRCFWTDSIVFVIVKTPHMPNFDHFLMSYGHLKLCYQGSFPAIGRSPINLWTCFCP